MPADNNDEDSSFDGLFSPIERIFADFERLFSSVPNIFMLPPQDFDEKSSSSSNDLRDEVLKQDSQNHNDVKGEGTSLFDHLFQDLQAKPPPRGDDNLDARIEQHGLDEALQSSSSSSSTKMTTMERRTTESGRCYEERRVEHSSTSNSTTQIETRSKICGDKHHTTVKENGRIIREYGNATSDELNRIDSLPDDDQPILGGQRHSDFFKKLFSS